MTVENIPPRALHGPGRLASLHVLAIRVPCPRPPKGCGVAAGDRCVNLSALREAGVEPPDMRAPHPGRLRAAEGHLPAPREPEPDPVEAADEPPPDPYDDEPPF